MVINNSLKRKIREHITAYAFMAPALVILAVFVFYPIIYSVPLAFYDYSGMTEPTFVGWDNFTKAIHDEEFWIAIKHSVMFVMVVPVMQVLSIMLASLVNKKIRGISFFRVLYYIPVVTSMIAVSIIWNWIFNENGGVLNGILMQLGLIEDPIFWLGDANLALFMMMFITLWQGLGYYMMLYLAGLQSLSPEMEEAAVIDGASKLKTFVKIKVPLLKPYVWFCSLLSVISAVSVFDVIFALKEDGGPDNATLVANLFSYRKAFMNFEFGYSAAIGVLVSIIILLLSIAVFAYGRRGGMSHNE